MNKDLALFLLASLIATLNPTLLAAMIVMFLLPHPRRLMLSYLAGAYTTTIAAGLAIVFSLHGSSVTRTSGHIASPAEEIAAGAIALTIALTIAFLLATGRDAPLRRWRERRKAAKASGGKAKQPWQQRMLGKGSAGVTFAIGAVMSFPGVTYLNALHHVVALNLPAVSILLLVMYFCLMQQILLELALLAFSFAPGGRKLSWSSSEPGSQAMATGSPRSDWRVLAPFSSCAAPSRSADSCLSRHVQYQRRAAPTGRGLRPCSRLRRAVQFVRRSPKPQFSMGAASCAPAAGPVAGLSSTAPISARPFLTASNSRQCQGARRIRPRRADDSFTGQTELKTSTQLTREIRTLTTELHRG